MWSWIIHITIGVRCSVLGEEVNRKLSMIGSSENSPNSNGKNDMCLIAKG